MSLPYDSRQSRFTSFDNFQKFVSTKKVLCKCDKTVSLENDEENRNDEGSNDERNRKRIAVRCQGLCDLEHINYSINSPASFGGGKKSQKTTNESSLCNKCEELNGNKRLGEALKAERATSSTVKFIHRHYYKQPLSELLKISNLRQFLAATNSKSDDAEFWIKVAQFGLSGAFSGDKTFAELVSLMVQIREKRNAGQIRRTDSIVVTNPDLSWHILRNYEKLVSAEKPNHIAGENDATATQVRGIASKIPIGKVAPMIVAMISTKGDEGADQIAHLNSSTDDARSEFNAQSIIRNEASNFLEYKVSLYKIHFKAPLYHDKPFIRVQDPKHAKKTARNQTFSGVRHISLGIDTVRNDQLFELAHQSQHFLLKRNVLNVEKQDDCITYFHSNTLMQISVSGTLTDDLFVLGQLHKTRIEILQKSFISIQSYDTSMVESLIQQRVSYRDKISRAGIIDTNRERDSAAECTRVAFNEAMSLAKYIHIDNHEESSIPEFIAHIGKMTDDEEDNQHNELNELMNTSDEASLDRSSIVGNVALEISRILSDSQNENDQLYEENLDDNENEEVIQQLPSVGEFPDIQNIIQHTRPIPITFHPFQPINNNQIQEINGNAVNKLITEITANNIGENQRRRRRD
ncbi:hypothetical protein RhiirA1_464123 [Rhizophagus irregularis]|uniref:Uncharacterized protein n=1 Tax=Rhizophagus irregularis TaxID=588596 RepID=A0A2I1E0Z9_9GLOM|nr:hypothetical protein RhiirA1_464123 [Rhizophagus irregularis]PKY15804.1 hypothetical protein RhiirB3_428060 [Rhizophagus irregularis]